MEFVQLGIWAIKIATRRKTLYVLLLLAAIFSCASITFFVSFLDSTKFSYYDYYPLFGGNYWLLTDGFETETNFTDLSIEDFQTAIAPYEHDGLWVYQQTYVPSISETDTENYVLLTTVVSLEDSDQNPYLVELIASLEDDQIILADSYYSSLNVGDIVSIRDQSLSLTQMLDHASATTYTGFVNPKTYLSITQSNKATFATTNLLEDPKVLTALGTTPLRLVTTNDAINKILVTKIVRGIGEVMFSIIAVSMVSILGIIVLYYFLQFSRLNPFQQSIMPLAKSPYSIPLLTSFQIGVIMWPGIILGSIFGYLGEYAVSGFFLDTQYPIAPLFFYIFSLVFIQLAVFFVTTIKYRQNNT